LKNEHSMPLD